MLDCQLAVLENAFARYFATGEVPGSHRNSASGDHPISRSTRPATAMLQSLSLAGPRTNGPMFCALLDRVDLIDDERFVTSWSRTLNYDVLNPMIEDGMRKKSTAQWLEELTEAGIPCGPVQQHRRYRRRRAYPHPRDDYRRSPPGVGHGQNDQQPYKVLPHCRRGHGIGAHSRRRYRRGPG